MFTQRHFNALAAALRRAKPMRTMLPGNHYDHKRRGTWMDCVREVSAACAESNHRFNMDQFMRACGVEEDNEDE